MLNRRQLLKTGAAAAGAFVTGCATAGTAQRKIRLGCQMWSIKTLWEKDLPGALQAIKGFGFEGVQCAAFWKQDAKRLHALLEDNGLVLADMPVQPDQLKPEQRNKTVDFVKSFGVDFVYVPWFGGKTAEDWKRFADGLASAAEALEPQGIRVGYHNHVTEFTQKWNGAGPLDILSSQDAKICFELDVGHCKMAGEDPAAWLRKLSGRVPSIHAGPAGGNALGEREDKMDWKTVVPLCRKIGVRWVVVECEARQNTYDDVKASIAFLKGIV